MFETNSNQNSLTMKLTSHIMHKVRKSATRRLLGKTSLPSDKSLEEDWTPDSPTSTESPSEEFSADGFDANEFPDMPPVSRRSVRIEEKRERGYYQRSPRVVTFDEEVLVRRVRPVYQIGGAIDRRELWYQEDEYNEIMWKARRLVKRAHNDENNENKDKYCLRGLEHVTNSIKRRTEANLDGREAVLDEQNSQFQEGVFPLDDDKIASLYVPFTRDHRSDALERAKWDAKEVELYQRTPSSTEATPPASFSSNSSTKSLQSLSSLPAPHSPVQQQTQSYSASGNKSPSSPTLINKPGMMFTCVNKTIQYPPGMRIEPI